MIRISVVTVAYKNSKVVVDLLNSIQRYNDIGDELEVVIVDNSPKDCRIEEAIKIAEYKNYKYIPADNRGFGAGNNIGAAVAQGEILAFLNPDIILIEPIFKKILQKFANDDKLAWIGGQLLDKKGKRNLSFGYRPEFTPVSFFEVFKFRLDSKKGSFDVSKMFLLGADIIIRKTIFEEIGHFDEKIFMYNEDSDLTKKILEVKAGYKIQFCTDIRMIHLEGHSLAMMSDARQAIDMESMIYYFKKHIVDYDSVISKIYAFEKQKLVIDKIFRPIKARWREHKIHLWEKKILELKE